MDTYEKLDAYTESSRLFHPFSSWRKSLGDLGELAAGIYLEGCGFVILEANWRRHRLSEIDLIVSDKDKDSLLVFVEVKTRSLRSGKGKHRFDLGVESVTRAKRRTIKQAAFSYLASSETGRYRTVRFDVISISMPNLTLLFREGVRYIEVKSEDVRILHIPDAFS